LGAISKKGFLWHGEAVSHYIIEQRQGSKGISPGKKTENTVVRIGLFVDLGWGFSGLPVFQNHFFFLK
jgi:hypothetical protein